MSMLVGLMEKGLLPDALIRRGIRRLLRKRLQDEDHGCVDVNRERQRQLFSALAEGPLAVSTEAAKDHKGGTACRSKSIQTVTLKVKRLSLLI